MVGPVEQRILADLAPGFAPRLVDVGGGATLRVLEGGPGDAPPLVMLHGRGLAATSLYPLLPGLASEHRVLAVDLPGFGSSTARPHPGPHDARSARAFFADPIAALLEKERVVAPSVFGHSLGGLVALDLALRPAVGVEKLVLVASMGFGPEGSLAARLFFNVGPERLARALGERVFARLSPSTNPTLGALAHELYTAPGGRAEAARAFRALVPIFGPAPHLADRLPEVKAETLVFWGEKDEAFPASLAAAAVAAIPRARLHMTPYGHSPHVEDVESALSVLRGFLRR